MIKIFTILMTIFTSSYAFAAPPLCKTLFPIERENSFNDLAYVSERPLDLEESVHAFQLLRNFLPQKMIRYRPIDSRTVGPFMLFFSKGDQIGFSYNRYAREPQIIFFAPHNILFIKTYSSRQQPENFFVRVFFALPVEGRRVQAVMTFFDFDENQEPYGIDFSYVPRNDERFSVSAHR